MLTSKKPLGIQSILELSPNEVSPDREVYVHIMSKGHGVLGSLWDDLVHPALGIETNLAVQFWNTGEWAGHAACCKDGPWSASPQAGCGGLCHPGGLWAALDQYRSLIMTSCDNLRRRPFELTEFLDLSIGNMLQYGTPRPPVTATLAYPTGADQSQKKEIDKKNKVIQEANEQSSKWFDFYMSVNCEAGFPTLRTIPAAPDLALFKTRLVGILSETNKCQTSSGTYLV
jgi:hypothetical protein